jgi:hypothetical protein
MEPLDSPTLVPEKLTLLAELVTALRNQGNRDEYIIDKLKEKGLSEAEIEQVMAHAAAGGQSHAKVEGRQAMIIGAVWLGVGLIISFGSYYWALYHGGGRYFTSYLVYLIGIYKLIQGLIRYNS